MPIDAAHIFVTDRAEMTAKFATIRPLLSRTVILPATDLVDVKVCAADAVWSGLKLLIRKSAR